MNSTPIRGMRIKDEIWLPAMRRAKAEGESVTAAVVRFLARYGKDLPMSTTDTRDEQIKALRAEIQRQSDSEQYDAPWVGPGLNSTTIQIDGHLDLAAIAAMIAQSERAAAAKALRAEVNYLRNETCSGYYSAGCETCRVADDLEESADRIEGGQ